MTLTRQLILTMSVLILVAMIGVELIHLRAARQHQQNQLESLAQDASTSLGLSLGVMLKEGDRSLTETVINPAFDRGHYQLIEFVSPNGDVLVRKTLSSGDIGAYPAWFAELFPLYPPTAESFVSTGWRQLGKLRVRAHPRFAYEQLWQTARETLIYLLAIYAAGLIALRLILTGILRPLAAVEQAAAAISARDFVTIDARPGTRELARVVDAMNGLSRKVRDSIAAETSRAAALQRAAYEDEVSGLLNRRGMIDQFETAYGDEREAFSGTLALIGISNLAEINRELGQQRCDALLRGAGDEIAAVAKGRGGFSARWGGAQFVLVLPGVRSLEAREVLDSLRARLSLALMEAGLESSPSARVGAVSGHAGQAQLEALVDAANELLVLAIEQSDQGIEVREMGGGTATLDRDPASLRQLMLGDFKVVLVGQDVLALPGREVMHTEIMTRVPGTDGALMPASQFMAILAREGLTRRLDETVVEGVARALAALGVARALSINLSARSLEEGDFIEWLVARVSRLRASSSKLVFEMSEHGIMQDEKAAERLAIALARAGAGFAIDHFGVHRDSIALLPRFKPAYLKLAGIHTAKAVSDAGTQLLVESIVRAARQLDVPVIAQSVETADQLTGLQRLGVSGYQGYLAGAPVEWPSVTQR